MFSTIRKNNDFAYKLQKILGKMGYREDTIKFFSNDEQDCYRYVHFDEDRDLNFGDRANIFSFPTFLLKHPITRAK